MTTPRFSRVFAIPAVLLLALFGLLSSCSENPTDADVSVPMEGEAKIDPGSAGQVLLSRVEMGPGFEGRVEVWAFDLAVESDSVVGFDLVLVNRTDADIPAPLQFVITSIVPRTVVCLNPDGYLRDRLPFFDLSDDMGADSVLTPGEATAPVRVRFRWEEPTAFSIGFRLVMGEVLQRGVIAGVVFVDFDQDGLYDEGEAPIPGVPVELQEAPYDSTGGGTTVLVHTDRLGRYAFSGLAAGVYRVEALLPRAAVLTTPNPLLVALVQMPDGTVSSFLRAHFGVAPVVPPRPLFVFGPVPVGPGSPNGTQVDSTFAIPTPMPPFPPEKEIYYVRVEPPLVAGPCAMFVRKASVRIDGELVFKFECPRDTLCPVFFDRVPIDPALTSPGAHGISIEVIGSERSFLLVGIERGISWDPSRSVR